MNFRRKHVDIRVALTCKLLSMNDFTCLIISISIPAGILAGLGAVAVFNRMPARWLCDYNEEPCELLKRDGAKRINNYPWGFIFSAFFAAAAVKMALFNWQYAIVAFVSLWTLLVIAIADRKYMIIPDQFVILLAITAFAYPHYNNGYLFPLWGALIGGGCMFIIGIFGKIIYKKETLGFGDVKLFAAVGLVAGPVGVSFILAASSFLSCAAFVTEIVRKNIKRTDTLALGPYIAASAAVYLIFV